MEMGKECWATIRFDLSQVHLEQVFQLEALLSEMGIHFDRGCGCGGRDWEWDYSLKGPVKVLFTGDAKEGRPSRGAHTEKEANPMD